MASDDLANAGMTTDATWADIDNDGWTDLIVTIDRGPIRVFTNLKGQLTETTAEAGLQDLRGWWQAIDAGDVDQDGDVDFIVGNLGLNTAYQASRDRPEVVYYGDFDGSQRRHILEVTYDESMRVPRRGLDALHQAMPSLAAAIESFQQYASTSIDELIDSQALDLALRLESNTLESGVLFNDGMGVFRFEPLPAEAQLAPCRGVAVADLNRDGLLDLALAQNFFAANAEIGAMDGGLGAVLLGRPSGGFTALSPIDSGVVVPGDASDVAAVDLDGDGWLDLVFAVNNGPLTALENQAAE
jgi:hypothetical protein